MNKTTCSEKTRKSRLLGVIRALDARGRGKSAPVNRQSRETSDLLRRYFVMQVAQIAADAR